MRTREAVAWGAVVGTVVAFSLLSAQTRGPGPDTPGEATTSILGLVVDRVPIPADPDGQQGLPTDRIMQGVLATITGTAVVSGCIGGLVGWGLRRARQRQRQTETGSVLASVGN